MLLQVYETQKANQLSQTVAIAEGFDNWQQQLQVWDQAIAQVRHALQFYPDEPQLLAQLQSLYQQQLELTNKIQLNLKSLQGIAAGTPENFCSGHRISQSQVQCIYYSGSKNYNTNSNT